MGFSTVPCNEFVEVLASKAPVPGGGGASALVGAIGTALGNMVGSLTVGKKKYADVEEEMWELKKKAELDEITGIGTMKKTSLLKAFGSVEKIKEADVEEIAKVKGINLELAKKIKDKLVNGDETNK